ALAILADEGKLRWDDPVKKHVPYFRLSDPAANEQVVLRDLCCHRTGLGSHDLLWYRAPWGAREAVERAGRLRPDGPFRSSYHYQSVMFMAAGEAVASASGTTWDEFVRRRLLDPLGLKDVCLTTTAALEQPDHASAHRKDGRGKVEVIPWCPM